MTRRRSLILCGCSLASITPGCLQAFNTRSIDSRFADTDVPDLTRWPESEPTDTAWYHEAHDEEVYLEPSAEQMDQPTGSIEFTLHNDGSETIEVNPSGRGLFKLVDDDWVRIAPLVVELPLARVSSGESLSRTFEFDNGDQDELSLGDGLYAYYYGDIQYAALFEVGGSPLDPEPTDAITETETDELADGSEAVTVVTEQHEEPDEDAKRATITMEQVDAAGDVQILLPEHVAQSDPLANTLPFFEEDVTEVRLRTSGAARGFRFFHILSSRTDVLDGGKTFEYVGDDGYYDVSMTLE